MNSLVNYLIESGVSLGILAGIYFLLLRNETFFKWNRGYLLFAALFSSVLPFIHFEIDSISPQIANQFPVSDNGQSMQYMLETVTVYGNQITSNIGNYVLSFNMFSLFFTIGVSVFLSLLLVRTVSITRLLKKGKIEKQREFIWVRLNFDTTPFSFFNLVFTGNNNTATEECMDQVLSHELVHVRQYHSVDVMVIELLTILQWWNPFLWILKQVIRENHEFLADQSVLAKGWSKSEYKTLLLQQRLGVNPILANNFNLNLINNRFKMMSKMKSKKIKLIKYGTGIIVCSALIAVFACDVKGFGYSKNPEIEVSKQVITAESTKISIAETVADNNNVIETKIENSKRKPLITVMDTDSSLIIRELIELIRKDILDTIIIADCNNILESIIDNSQIKPHNTKFVTDSSLIILHLSEIIRKHHKQAFDTSRDKNVLDPEKQIKQNIDRTISSPDSNVIYKLVEEMPEFPGGGSALSTWFGSNINYPKEALKKGIQGKVYVCFVIEKNGSVSNAKILRGIDPMLDTEALRVINSMPKWIPGKLNDEAVNCYVNVPINFDLK